MRDRKGPPPNLNVMDTHEGGHVFSTHKRQGQGRI